MKRLVRLCAAALALLALFCGLVAQAEGSESIAPADLPQLPFLGKTLVIAGVLDSPSYVEGNPPLQGERLLLVKFAVPDGGIAIRDLLDYIGCFWLEDPNEDYYEALAYLPKNMVFIAKNGVFGTAQTQTGFQLLFCVPEDFTLEDLALMVEDPNTKVGSVEMSKVPLLPED